MLRLQSCNTACFESCNSLLAPHRRHADASHLSVCPSVCLSVCNALTVESLDLESLFLVRGYSFKIVR